MIYGLVVGMKLLADGRGRWLALALSVGVSGAMLLAHSTPPAAKSPVAAPAPAAAVATGAPIAPPIAKPLSEADLLAAGAPVDPHTFELKLMPGVADEHGLQIKTIWAARAISVLFPDITTIGGYRQDALKWHPNGLAIDVMIPNHSSPEGIELGNQIAGYALANAKQWGVLHVIWRQALYPGIGAPSWTADYGNETLNHFDHVHIATDGGGYPTGHETYYIGRVDP